jgi:hypothetical protein
MESIVLDEQTSRVLVAESRPGLAAAGEGSAALIGGDGPWWTDPAHGRRRPGMTWHGGS